jgi:hypothetical protein
MRVSLHSLHGKVVVLSFNDPECTTICPLTTTAVLQAKKVLGSAASQVALVGVGANPEATKLKWVRDDSRVHGMLHKWRFLTGSLAELKRVWRAYYVAAAVVNGSIDHTPCDVTATHACRRRYPWPSCSSTARTTRSCSRARAAAAFASVAARGRTSSSSSTRGRPRSPT